MASITKDRDKWRAQIYVKGVRESKSFRIRREALAWASAREEELHTQANASPFERYTLADVLKRYLADVAPGKRGLRYERVRIAAWLGGEKGFPGTIQLRDLTPDVIGRWRDFRLGQVQAGTVLRELKLLSAALTIASREWGWIPSNPIRDVRKPTAPDHRDVVISWGHIRTMLRSLGWTSDGRISQTRQAVACCFLAALRTGMRAGELCGLTWDRVRDDHVVLPVTKTKPRSVPLTRQARRTIERMRGWDETLVFGMKSSSLDAMFRKYRERAGLSGFTFHDARHTAATMLARRIDVLDLCKMFGWTNPKMAMVYYNPTASEIAKRLQRRNGAG